MCLWTGYQIKQNISFSFWLCYDLVIISEIRETVRQAKYLTNFFNTMETKRPYWDALHHKGGRVWVVRLWGRHGGRGNSLTKNRVHVRAGTEYISSLYIKSWDKLLSSRQGSVGFSSTLLISHINTRTQPPQNRHTTPNTHTALPTHTRTRVEVHRRAQRRR